MLKPLSIAGRNVLSFELDEWMVVEKSPVQYLFFEICDQLHINIEPLALITIDQTPVVVAYNDVESIVLNELWIDQLSLKESLRPEMTFRYFLLLHLFGVEYQHALILFHPGKRSQLIFRNPESFPYSGRRIQSNHMWINLLKSFTKVKLYDWFEEFQSLLNQRQKERLIQGLMKFQQHFDTKLDKEKIIDDYFNDARLLQLRVFVKREIEQYGK